MDKWSSSSSSFLRSRSSTTLVVASWPRRCPRRNRSDIADARTHAQRHDDSGDAEHSSRLTAAAQHSHAEQHSVRLCALRPPLQPVNSLSFYGVYTIHARSVLLLATVRQRTRNTHTHMCVWFKLDFVNTHTLVRALAVQNTFRHTSYLGKSPSCRFANYDCRAR